MRGRDVQVPGPVCPVPCCHQSRARASAYPDANYALKSAEVGHDTGADGGADAILLRELDRYDNTGFTPEIFCETL